jgi:hypothetical protein
VRKLGQLGAGRSLGSAGPSATRSERGHDFDDQRLKRRDACAADREIHFHCGPVDWRCRVEHGVVFRVVENIERMYAETIQTLSLVSDESEDGHELDLQPTKSQDHDESNLLFSD